MAQGVPSRYLGVWRRTLLRTPERTDTTSWVHWLQTEHWHGDLRVPAYGSRRLVQGFGGQTTVARPQATEPEVCTWHRRIDLEPPRPTPDEGHMVFEGSERVIETGIHGPYLEVWERVPESIGPTLALARGPEHAPELFLVAGHCAMHLRPAERRAHLRIAYGMLNGGHWNITRATHVEWEGQRLACAWRAEGEGFVLEGHRDLAGWWRRAGGGQGRSG